MDKISASHAKQQFGRILERAAKAPVAIERHGKCVAAMVPADWLDKSELFDERRAARQRQRQVEQDRLIAHQRLGIELLSRKDRGKALLNAARTEVRRWSRQQLCSQDYIDRWTEWLALPEADLVARMCSDADGWGHAMRQNSPFMAARP